MNQLLSNLPEGYCHPIVLCLHRLKTVRNGFAEALQINSRLLIREPDDKEPIRKGRVYLAPSNYHLMLEHTYHFSLSISEPVNHSRPSLDITFDTAGEVFGNKAVGVLLSGANMDGAKGMYKIKKEGGITIVEDPKFCEIGTMPEACINLFHPDYILDADKIINFIKNL